jgi:hypothetical protein
MSVDPALQMFISVCCTHCRDMDCSGALTDTTKRLSCQKYINWLKLPKDKQTQLFMTSTISEIELMEELTNE